jgi:DNA-binding transcriptional MerR regulator
VAKKKPATRKPRFAKTQPELARIFGVTVAAVQAWRKKGMPEKTDKGYSVSQIKKWYEANINAHKKPGDLPPTGSSVGVNGRGRSDDLTPAEKLARKAKLEAAQVGLQKDREDLIAKRRKNELAQGLYVTRSDVERFVAELLIEVRSLFERLGPEVSAKYDPEIRRIIQSDIDGKVSTKLNQLHDWLIKVRRMESAA